jgi:ArsR family transcriptional regulator, arsenate/arsenite/antimonite-responsive transcriptional repressor / arsenate reductase (thioredoxin)
MYPNVETIEAVLTFLYNGCSIHNQALRTEGDQQIPELNTEKTSSQESFMFEDFFRSVQTFFGGLPFEMPGFERFTEKAIQVITLAQKESRRLKHQYVGTEQILLGLLAQETGLVAQFFKSVGIELEPVRQAIEGQIGRGKGTPEKIPFTPRAKTTLDIALKQAKQLKHSYIGTEHMLLGLLIERQGLGVQVLEKLGFKCETLEQQLRIAIEQSSV